MTKKLPTVKCGQCKAPFKPRTGWQVYCKEACRIKAWRKSHVWVKLPGKAK